MKKFTKLMTTSAAALFLLSACGSGETDEDVTRGDNGEGTSELTAWTWDPNFNVVALELAESTYQEENSDFSLNIVENAQPDVVQRLNTSLSSGVDTGLPNIVMIEDYRAQGFLNSYPEAFYPVGDYYNQEDFADYKVAVGTVDGQVYGVPFDSSVTGVYVRTDILEQAGYSTEDLEGITWAEYMEIGKDVYEQTGVKWVTSDHNDLGLIRTMLHSSGIWFTEEDGVTPNIAGNESLRLAFETYKEMFDSEIMNVHNGWDQYVQAFNEGTVATQPAGNWLTPSIKAAEDQSGDWAVVSYPRQDIEGSVNASNLGGSSLYVLNIDGKEAAAEFLGETFGSSEALYQDLVTEIGAIGAYEPAIGGEAYATEDEFFGGQSIYQDFAQWAQEIPEVNFGEHTYAIEDILSVSLQEYLGGADLDTVLENAQQQAESAL